MGDEKKARKVLLPQKEKEKERVSKEKTFRKIGQLFETPQQLANSDPSKL